MLTLSPDIEALIRARAVAEGKTPDELIREALAGPQAPTSVAKNARIDRAGLATLLSELDAMPIRDTRPAKVILDEGWRL